MGRIAAFVVLGLLLAGCGGGGAVGFYDESAKEVAKRTAADRVKPKGPGRKISVGSADEQTDCPQPPSPHAGPCVAVELTIADEARPIGGGDSQGTVKTTSDVFIWLAKKGGRWKVTHVTNGPPRDVSFNGVPYSPSG